MNPFEKYIRELRIIRSSGEAVAETSYYTHLNNLLNEIGKLLKPRVHCIINIKNRGAGIPDGGLFTSDQIPNDAELDMVSGQLPVRGVIEAKPTGADNLITAESNQVSKYWKRYGQVLVTNFRDFVLVGKDSDGNPIKMESYSLAENESAFWAATADPSAISAEHSERFIEYLKRVMLHAAPLAAPEDVAWFLASYARDAKKRIESVDLPALTTVRSAFEEALGLKFEGQKGDRFFRSTLIQTLFYGVFSAWVLWSKQHPPVDRSARFDWRMAIWSLRVPMIKALFEQIATPSKLGPLGLVEVLDWTMNALNRVDRASFFSQFEDKLAIQYFYEPFLQAFDPELRKDLGVWYTPSEIVQYMVARVDAVLREELDIEDGLADPRVYILDPCCGTGAYLVEVLKRIALIMEERGSDALGSDDLKRAAMDRVFGFEILPAPFVVAHLQLGLLLQNLGAPLSDAKNERVGVYLTNALTGWEPPKQPKTRLLFPELEEERDAAEKVKREVPILVILGNPPYNGFAGVALDEERDLTNAYRTAKRAAAPQGQGLNDLYVRFFRMAERRIVESTGKGVICFISNYSWLDGLSFTGMREKYLEVFDQIWIDCLNGDKYKTGKLTPEGDSDPSVFSTSFNPEGIQVGTVISLLTRKEKHAIADSISFRHLWGKTKRAQLLESAIQNQAIEYQEIKPPVELGFPFMHAKVQTNYLSWPLLTDIFPISFSGVKTSRDDAVVDIDREKLIERMEKYFDPKITNETLRQIIPTAVEDAARFNAKSTRDYLCKRGFLPNYVVRYCYRPFDVRWLYWEPETKLLDEKRSEYFGQISSANIWLAAAQRHRKDFDPPSVSSRLCSLHIIERGSNFFPLRIRPVQQELSFSSSQEINRTNGSYEYNLSEKATDYITRIGNLDDAEHLFYHTIAVLHSLQYRIDNSGALRQNWPRIPLPNNKDLLLESAALGRQIAALLDTETPVKGVTASAIRPELKRIGVISRAGGGTLNLDAGELNVTANWGHAGKGGVTMPGKGKIVERDYTPEESAAFQESAATLGLTLEQIIDLMGEAACDVYLNETAYWKNIPKRVWEYALGGYQVIKKWLSYREYDLLNRSLTKDEAREVTNIAHRIAAILLLEPNLNANYEIISAKTSRSIG